MDPNTDDLRVLHALRQADPSAFTGADGVLYAVADTFPSAALEALEAMPYASLSGVSNRRPTGSTDYSDTEAFTVLCVISWPVFRSIRTGAIGSPVSREIRLTELSPFGGTCVFAQSINVTSSG